MKKILVLTVAALLAFSSAALAAGSATLNVSATVQGTCAFDAASADLNFGQVDPALLGGADVTGSTTIAFTCSSGTQATVTDNSSGNLTGALGGTLPYALAYTVPAGTGLSQDVTIAGTIANAAFVAAVPDVYTETITLTINP